MVITMTRHTKVYDRGVTTTAHIHKVTVTVTTTYKVRVVMGVLTL